MMTVTWKSIKSPIMQEIRVALKKKSEKGQPSISRKEANRTWREEILGILSEDQKRQRKEKRQSKNSKPKVRVIEDEED